jgi:hypothetical protein
VRAAALPGRAGQGRPDRGDQPVVGVGGDQRDAGQAAGGQVAEEPEPAGAVLGGGHLQAQDLPVSIGVHARGNQGVHVHHPPALTHLEHQGVRGHKGVGAGIERAAAELRDLGVELGGHHADLRLRQASDPEGVDELLHPPGGHPEQITGRHHRGQCAFGPAAALEQPVG